MLEDLINEQLKAILSSERERQEYSGSLLSMLKTESDALENSRIFAEEVAKVKKMAEDIYLNKPFVSPLREKKQALMEWFGKTIDEHAIQHEANVNIDGDRNDEWKKAPHRFDVLFTTHMFEDKQQRIFSQPRITWEELENQPQPPATETLTIIRVTDDAQIDKIKNLVVRGIDPEDIPGVQGVEVLEMKNDQPYLTLVKIGSEDYKPSPTDLEAFRDVFLEAQEDPDYTIFTHDHVSIERYQMNGNGKTLILSGEYETI